MFECSCSKCLSPLEEDGLMLSLQCSDFSCNGAIPRDLSGNVLKYFNCLVKKNEVGRLQSFFEDLHLYKSEHASFYNKLCKFYKFVK